MNATTNHTETKEHKILRYTASIALGLFGAVCLYAVLFLNRPDHLFTTACYAAMVWMINRDYRKRK